MRVKQPVHHLLGARIAHVLGWSSAGRSNAAAEVTDKESEGRGNLISLNSRRGLEGAGQLPWELPQWWSAPCLPDHADKGRHSALARSERLTLELRKRKGQTCPGVRGTDLLAVGALTNLPTYVPNHRKLSSPNGSTEK